MAVFASLYHAWLRLPFLFLDHPKNGIPHAIKDSVCPAGGNLPGRHLGAQAQPQCMESIDGISVTDRLYGAIPLSG